jgi:hypothetical protein
MGTRAASDTFQLIQGAAVGSRAPLGYDKEAAHLGQPDPVYSIR